MKCKNCGGELIFQNGMGLCESCKNTYRLDYGFENTEVYICYTESDAQGRRTKDSIIAEDLYQKLESKKIHTFYERRSAPALIGDDLQAANYQAIYHAKIILVVGVSAAHFEHLVSKHDKYFGDKTVIPVYTDIRPEQLPPELNRVQALNLNSIGADVDLLNGILRLLGREKEINLESLHQRTVKRKKIAAIIFSLLLIIGVAATAVILLFRESPAEPESEPVLTSQEIYDNAQALMESGDYLGAADLLASISDFRNSTNLLNEIYNRYDGYYKNEDVSCSLYLNIIDSQSAEFIFEKSLDGKVVRVEETATIVDNTISAKYIDSLSNEGDISLALLNDKVEIDVTTNIKTGNLYLGDIHVAFSLTKKTDRPMNKEVTRETILSWMTNLTYVEDLKTAGYELEYIDHSDQYDFSLGIQYKIVNTDVTIITEDYDLSKYTAIQQDKPKLKDNAIFAVIAPAVLVCPEKIGQTSPVFLENDIAYVPNVTNIDDSQEALDFVADEELEYEQTLKKSFFSVTKDSFVGIVSKKLFGAEQYNHVIESRQNHYYKVMFVEQNSIKDSYEHIKLVSKKSNAALVCIRDHSSKNFNDKYYKMNLSTFKADFITQLVSPNDYEYENWKNYPELFSEFL
uniref:toll/interleukin-1 receptor domain-containing protein n=1 Tax=Eubacterium sp. TaxID=142586 RepID=UPI0040272A8B